MGRSSDEISDKIGLLCRQHHLSCAKVFRQMVVKQRKITLVSISPDECVHSDSSVLVLVSI